MNKKVLVTGGCGFIGSNLVRLLLKGGSEVGVLDNQSTGHAGNLAGTGAKVMTGDIRSAQETAEAVKGMDVVIHLAAYGSVVDSVEHPEVNFDVNARGTLCLLRECVKANVGRFVFASTGGALIGNAEPPVDENSIPKPISPYGAGKLCCEAYCNAFAHSYGLRTVILRFSNVYGPYSAHKKGAVTAFIKAIQGDEPFTIYGDGRASRDYLYVSDLCQGVVQALEADLEPATVLHLASGVETTVDDLAGMIAEVAGKPGHETVHLPARRGEVGRNFASHAYASRRIGFTPSVPLRLGLEKTWDWFSSKE